MAGPIVVTGIGIVSPLGKNVDSFATGLLGCHSCLERLSVLDIDLASPPTVAQIHDLPQFEEKPGFRLSRTDVLALQAAKDALSRAAADRELARRAGVVVASTVGGLTGIELGAARNAASFVRQGGGFSSLTSYQIGHVPDVVASYLGLEGPRLGVSVACASGAMAIALGARMIHDGAAPIVLAGGSDALCRFTVSGFNALQALDPDPCTPFDKNRKGLNIGEGAAVLVLESREQAIARGAPILATLRGWAMSNDAYHPTAPHEAGCGLAQSMQQAMVMAHVGPDEIGYVNAHGTGTPLNDIAETKAYELAFGKRSGPIPVSSTKSYVGHNLAAAGSLEAVVTILSLRTKSLFPTLRLTDPIESDSVDWIMGGPRRSDFSFAMSVSAGFGGSNTSLLFEAAEWSV